MVNWLSYCGLWRGRILWQRASVEQGSLSHRGQEEMGREEREEKKEMFVEMFRHKHLTQAWDMSSDPPLPT